MSKMTKCKACDGEIAKSAKKCVHCGKDQRIFFMRHKIVTFILLVLVFIIFIPDIDTIVVDETIPVEEYKMQCENIPYNDIARDPDRFIDRKVKYTGEVIQTSETGSNIVLRINITENEYGYYEDTVWVNYMYIENEKRLLEDDIVKFWGEFKGLKSYKSVLGAKITIPEINARVIEPIE